MDPLKFYNGGNYAHAQVSIVYNFCSSSNRTKFIRTFIRQFLKSNNINGNNFSWSSNSTKLTRTFHFDDIFQSLLCSDPLTLEENKG